MIKGQFFHMVTHVFDNSNLSQEIFAIDTCGAIIRFWGHGRKHMLTILLTTVWRPGLTLIELGFFDTLLLSSLFLDLSQQNFVQGLTIKASA